MSDTIDENSVVIIETDRIEKAENLKAREKELSEKLGCKVVLLRSNETLCTVLNRTPALKNFCSCASEQLKRGAVADCLRTRDRLAAPTQIRAGLPSGGC